MLFRSAQRMSIPVYRIALLSCGLALVGVGVMGPTLVAAVAFAEYNYDTAAWKASIDATLESVFTTLDTMKTLEDKVEEAKPRAAFSAINPTSAIGGIGVSHPADTVLIYKKVFANHQNVYSDSDGKFTAPEDGAYFFTFMFHSRSMKSPVTGLSLFKNGLRVTNSGHDVPGREMVSTLHHNSGTDIIDHGGNSVILQLNEGDTVFVVIDEDMSIWGDETGHNTFSGYLLTSTVMGHMGCM